jgi:NSS family neurotransmitter:Na+ symporter
LLIGLPVMIAEITLGRTAKANPITALQSLAPKKSLPWWLVAIAGMAAAFLILSFYSEVVGLRLCVQGHRRLHSQQ